MLFVEAGGVDRAFLRHPAVGKGRARLYGARAHDECEYRENNDGDGEPSHVSPQSVRAGRPRPGRNLDQGGDGRRGRPEVLAARWWTADNGFSSWRPKGVAESNLFLLSK